MLSCLTETTLQSKSEPEALAKLLHIDAIKDLPMAHLLKLQESAVSSTILMSKRPLEKLNALLAKHELSPVNVARAPDRFDNDILF